MDSEKHFIIIGAPGSGKGTMAVRIAERLGLRHLSTGDLLREAVKSRSELGLEAEGYMNSGELVPDEIIVELLHQELEEHGYGNWILDGFPRTLHQTEMLETMLHENGADLDKVFLLEVDPEIIVRRLTNRRMCPVCNTIYNLVSPEFIPKVDGKCDKDGADLIRRKDDEEETIRNRLSVYEKQTAPVIEHYWRLGLLASVDGAAGVEKITAELIRLAT